MASPTAVFAPSRARPSEARTRVTLDGKFLRCDGRRYLVKGVTYGTFAPDAQGYQFPPASRVRSDFAAMAEAGLNTVRVYTVPRRDLVDAAAAEGLRVVVGLPWPQHLAFLDDQVLAARVRRDVREALRSLADHPGVLMFALGNEIPPSIVRWHGRERVEAFLRDLCQQARDVAPDALLTYVNFPPTEFLDLSPFDVCAFNVYLHREADLRAYLARLHSIAGLKPLLLAEAGADSLREGPDGQAAITAMHVRAAFEEGACGAVAFAWTDEWWRGGHDVTDWAFGLVDARRRPKPALEAVARAFAESPFPQAARERWPRVSVIVCAYNAAETLEEALESLRRLTYPDHEVVLVNDGSSDATGAIARRYPFARVIDIPNGGLSNARNVGLAHAQGDIVAYTDADVRVDPDWLTFLVQPFLRSDVVASGGPNVVPQEDSWMAQCVARSPGGPTHVLLDDRIAEHVPGCNMAYRREALQAIGGFNPIYVRAGDDVDVCWRLQARGGRVGFAPAALVWHHHRASVRAYWRQQVGYGEGEIWLMHQHPDKFAGGNVIWHGRIYSALPFIRSMTRMRVNTGMWGLAAFPSVYHTGARPMSYLPHSGPWLLGSAMAALAGLLALAFAPYPGASWLVLLLGLAGLATTVGRSIGYARQSDLAGLRVPGRSVRASAWILRSTIAGLHLVQPLARVRGRIRGRLQPPPVPAATETIPSSAARPTPTPHTIATALRLLAGAHGEQRFWSERWRSADDTLQRLLAALRLARITSRIDLDDGWYGGRDVSVALGRWAWIDLDVLIEEHAEGRTLLRVRSSFRPTGLAASVIVFAFVAIVVASLTLAVNRAPLGALSALVVAMGSLAVGAWRTASVHEGVSAIVRHAMTKAGAQPLDTPRLGFTAARRAGLRLSRAALATLLVVGLVVGSLSLARETYDVVLPRIRPAPSLDIASIPSIPGVRAPRLDLVAGPQGDLYVADALQGVVRRIDPRGEITTIGTTFTAGPDGPVAGLTRFDSPNGIALGADGHVYVADSQNHRVYRVDPLSGASVTVAGVGRPGFGGDGGPASRAPLDSPSAVLVDSQGDVIVADSGNHRVRRIDRRTGVITTLAGGGVAGLNGDVGDGGLATAAWLLWPSALAAAPNGDLFISDSEHHRVRKVDGRTGIIATAAGDGSAGFRGDGGPATRASLSAPSGLAIVPSPHRFTLYIADSNSGRIRVVTPDGRISSLALGDHPEMTRPERLAAQPSGGLYVADGASHRVYSLTLPAGRGRQGQHATVRRVL